MKDPAATTPPPRGWTPLQVALGYAVCSALWILFSDQALAAWFADPTHFALASAVKGWLFTGVTALLLYGLLHRRVLPTEGDATAAGAAPPQGSAAILPQRLGRQLLLAGLVTAALTAGSIAYTLYKHKASALQQMQTVASLKVQQTLDWLHDREMEAGAVAAGADPGPHALT